jgi:tape measure domain-containing protein
MVDRVIRVVIDSSGAETGGKKVEKSLDGIEGGSKSAKNAVGGLVAGLAAIAGSLVVREIIQYGDAWTQVNNQLRVNVDTTEEFLTAQQDVIGIALRTRSDLGATAQLYGRVTAAAGELGAKQSEVAQLTELAAQAIAVQGSTAGEASGALLQLSQLLGGNVVQAQEFNSLIDGARPLLVAVANGSDRFGGSVAKLREEVRSGTVTSKEFFAAALEGSDVIGDKFAKAQRTAAQGTTVFKTGLTVGIGTLNEFLGTTDAVVDVLTDASADFIKFAKAVTGGLKPTDDLTINMQAIAGGSVIAASALSLIGDVVRNSVTAPFKLAGKSVGNLASAFVSVAKGDYTEALTTLGLGLEDLGDGILNVGDEFNKSADKASSAMDRYNAIMDKSKRESKEFGGAVEEDLGKIVEAVRDQEITDKIEEIIASLQKQSATFGQTAAEAKIYELALLGANDAEISLAKSLIESIALSEERKAANDAVNKSLKDAEEQTAKNIISDEDAVAALREKLVLIRLTEREQVKLNATNVLSGDATVAQIEAVEAYTLELYDLAVAQEEIEERTKNLEEFGRDLAASMESAFLDSIRGGKDFDQILKSLIDDVIELIFRFTVLEPLTKQLAQNFASSGGGGFFDSLLGAIGLGGSDPANYSLNTSPGGGGLTSTGTGGFGYGLADGASFTVGGSGGIDSQFIPLALTPGETVDVFPPGQRPGNKGGATIMNTVSITVNADGSKDVNSNDDNLQALSDEIIALIDDRILDNTRNGGITA